MSDIGPPIVLTPYDLGLGFEIGWQKPVDVCYTCLISSCMDRANLIWQLVNAPKPLLVIKFDHVYTLRVLDEFWLSTETNSDRWKGIDGSFARTVTGCEYPTDRQMMKATGAEETHYQFVTGGDCVDVIAPTPPQAQLIGWEDQGKFVLEYPKHDLDPSD